LLIACNAVLPENPKWSPLATKMADGVRQGFQPKGIGHAEQSKTSALESRTIFDISAHSIFIYTGSSKIRLTLIQRQNLFYWQNQQNQQNQQDRQNEQNRQNQQNQ
jgi:hypothetical protein